MYNALEDIPGIEKLVQVSVRDLCEEEWNYVCNSNFRVVTYFDEEIKEKQFEGQQWHQITESIINHLPQQVYFSLDIDGSTETVPPHGNTGTRGLQTEEVLYLFKK